MFFAEGRRQDARASVLHGWMPLLAAAAAAAAAAVAAAADADECLLV